MSLTSEEKVPVDTLLTLAEWRYSISRGFTKNKSELQKQILDTIIKYSMFHNMNIYHMCRYVSILQNDGR